MAVAMKDARRDQFPTARKSRPGRGADENVLVEIPYRRLARNGIEQEVIWMTIAIKIGHPYHSPPGRKSRPVRGPDKDVVFQVPHYRLSGAPIVKEIIRLPVAVKISWRRRRRIHQAVTDDIEIDAFRRCSGDVGKLASTTKR